MSNSYLCIVPDFPNTIKARMEVRPVHLANVLSSDRLDLAGALAPEVPAASADGSPAAVPDFKGSAVIVRADSREDAIEFLKQDVYVAKGVWDVANAQVFAIFQAVRTQLTK